MLNHNDCRASIGLLYDKCHQSRHSMQGRSRSTGTCFNMVTRLLTFRPAFYTCTLCYYWICCQGRIARWYWVTYDVSDHLATKNSRRSLNVFRQLSENTSAGETPTMDSLYDTLNPPILWRSFTKWWTNPRSVRKKKLRAAVEAQEKDARTMTSWFYTSRGGPFSRSLSFEVFSLLREWSSKSRMKMFFSVSLFFFFTARAFESYEDKYLPLV